MRFFLIPEKTWPRRLSQLVVYILVLSVLGGCSKKEEVQTVLDHGPGFSLTVPKGYHVDVQLNPNDSSTSTWFREDGLAVLAIDRQPIAGKRLKALQAHGNKRYLTSLGRDLQRDLGNRLKEFSHVERTTLKIGKKDALPFTFHTRHEGTDYKVYILVTLQLGEQAHEIMIDLRVPLDEAEQDKAWSEILESWQWGEAKAGGHGEEKKADEGH